MTPVDRVLILASHQLDTDRPVGVSRVQRWTCAACGRAVLRTGHFYGSATTEPCDQSLVPPRRTCLAHLEAEPCDTCRAYIAAGL